MKTLVIILIATIGLNAQAMEINPEDLSIEKQARIMEALNDLEPEMINTLLSDEALEWYVKQFRKLQRSGDIEMSQIHGRVDLGSNPFDDENAPSF